LGNVPATDETLHRKVWGWLVAHPDINIEKRLSEESSGTVEIANKEEPPNDDNNSVLLEPIPKPPAGVPLDTSEASRHDSIKDLDGLYLTTTEERVWLSLTGHGPDFTRVKCLELQILSVLANHGPRGVAQPDLFILTGQDKRSLPGRTDALHEKGYIEKKPVLAHGTRTSLCTLTRFVAKSTVPKHLGGTDAVKDEEDCFRDGLLISDKFYDKAMRIIKEYGLITQTDFRRRMVRPSRSENF